MPTIYRRAWDRPETPIARRVVQVNGLIDAGYQCRAPGIAFVAYAVGTAHGVVISRYEGL